MHIVMMFYTGVSASYLYQYNTPKKKPAKSATAQKPLIIIIEICFTPSAGSVPKIVAQKSPIPSKSGQNSPQIEKVIFKE
jgi:hypothetical protein